MEGEEDGAGCTICEVTFERTGTCLKPSSDLGAIADATTVAEEGNARGVSEALLDEVFIPGVPWFSLSASSSAGELDGEDIGSWRTETKKWLYCQ